MLTEVRPSAIVSGMKRVILLAILGATAVAAVLAWSGGLVEKALNQRERSFEKRAMAAVKPPRFLPSAKLPRDPIARRSAVEAMLRLRPDRRFLLAASELGGGTAQGRFEGGRWVVAISGKDGGSVSELPDFAEMLEFLLPLAKNRIAAENVQGPPATDHRALRNEDEALPALRAAQAPWSAGQHTRGVLHEAAAAAAALAFYMVDVEEVADGLPAHAFALVALDAAAGNDARGSEAVLAAALDYDAAAERLLRALPGEAALKHFLAGDDAHLEEDAWLREATPADRYLHLRRLVRIGDERGVERWLWQAQPAERLSTAVLSQLARQPSMKAFAPAAFALPWYVGARVEGASIEGPTGPFADALSAGAESAAVRFAKDADPNGRIAAAARKLDSGASGPLLRADDTAAYFLAAMTSALWRQSEYYEYYQANRAAAQEFARKLGSHADPALHALEVVVMAIAANTGESAFLALAEPGQLGGGKAELLLRRIFRRVDYGDARFLESILMSAPRFDSRILSRIRWAHLCSTHLFEREYSRKLAASVMSAAPANHPEMARLQAWLSRDARALRTIALQKSLPFANREAALEDYVAIAPPVPAEETLKSFANAERHRADARTPLIRFLRRAGKVEKARAEAMDWLRRYDKRGLDAASMRCVISQLDFESGRWAAGLEIIQPALPAFPFCAPDLAAKHLLMLGRKEEAHRLVGAWLERYTIVEAIAEAAWVYWTEGDLDAAAGVLATSRRRLDNSDYYWSIGERFAKVFAKRPTAEMKTAVQALLAKGIHPGYVSDLRAGLTKEHAYEHAFVLGTLIDVPPPDRYVQLVRTAAALRAWKGPDAAREWFSAQIPRQLPAREAYHLASLAYREKLDEELGVVPDPQGDASMAEHVWLFRAAALARLGKRASPAFRAMVKAHYGSNHPGWEFQVGRHLLGDLNQKELLALVTDDPSSCEVPYYAGVKAQADGRNDETMSWYRDAVFCLRPNEAEFAWAYDALREIRDKERATD